MYEALITSAIDSADHAVRLGMDPAQVLISCKVSGVQDLVAVYRELARRCQYPLHLGLTEAGMGARGTVASAAALSLLLQDGIRDDTVTGVQTCALPIFPAPGPHRSRHGRARHRRQRRRPLAAYSDRKSVV